LRYPDHTKIDTQPIWLLCTSDQLVAETSSYKTQTNATGEHSCPQRDPNSQSKQSIGRRFMP